MQALQFHIPTLPANHSEKIQALLSASGGQFIANMPPDSSKLENGMVRKMWWREWQMERESRVVMYVKILLRDES